MTIENPVTYQPCRWVDAYPQLGFALNLMKLLPQQQQHALGQQLIDFVLQRVPFLPDHSAFTHGYDSRWYDTIPSLQQGLQQLQKSPDSMKQQAGVFLLQSIQKTHRYSA